MGSWELRAAKLVDSVEGFDVALEPADVDAGNLILKNGCTVTASESDAVRFCQG